MSVTENVQQWQDKLSEWEEALRTYEPSQFSNTLDYWLDKAFDYLPSEMKDMFFSQIDTWLFHLHGFIQQSSFQRQAEERIIKMAQSYKEEIETIEDIQSLTLRQKAFIADQQIAKQKLYSLVQGGMTGTGKFSTLAVDIPAFAALNIRTTQLIALSYGYRASSPNEMVKALQLFYCATVPKKYQYQRWQSLKEELGQEQDFYFDTLSEKDHPAVWLQQPLFHLVKLIFVIVLSRRKVNGIPVLGILTAAGSNYFWTKEVSGFAHHYYVMRHLSEWEN
ncbi:EcsC family protein [Sutcliffiella halmapala]|uniref:EcsC family protein n=1 Tax=Sutcliffiella halmapala TaxID=79882 RepID=UPI0014750BF6|nr:EcsC family protein [Sutcliffiella halmapala]